MLRRIRLKPNFCQKAQKLTTIQFQKNILYIYDNFLSNKIENCFVIFDG